LRLRFAVLHSRPSPQPNSTNRRLPVPRIENREEDAIGPVLGVDPELEPPENIDARSRLCHVQAILPAADGSRQGPLMGSGEIRSGWPDPT
jgi:hypothetical protein